MRTCTCAVYTGRSCPKTRTSAHLSWAARSPLRPSIESPVNTSKTGSPRSAPMRRVQDPASDPRHPHKRHLGVPTKGPCPVCLNRKGPGPRRQLAGRGGAQSHQATHLCPDKAPGCAAARGVRGSASYWQGGWVAPPTSDTPVSRQEAPGANRCDFRNVRSRVVRCGTRAAFRWTGRCAVASWDVGFHLMSCPPADRTSAKCTWVSGRGRP